MAPFWVSVLWNILLTPSQVLLVHIFACNSEDKLVNIDLTLLTGNYPLYPKILVYLSLFRCPIVLVHFGESRRKNWNVSSVAHP